MGRTRHGGPPNVTSFPHSMLFVVISTGCLWSLSLCSFLFRVEKGAYLRRAAKAAAGQWLPTHRQDLLLRRVNEKMICV